MTKSRSHLLDHLNDRQKVAVTHTEGPMLILAGAGSGKTRAITHKVAYLIEQGISAPDRILAVTFTNKAADEMRSRIEQMLSGIPSLPVISTFHSFGVRLLRRHAEAIHFGRDFTICDTDDQKSILRRICQDLGISNTELPVSKIQAIISRAKNQPEDPREYFGKLMDPAAKLFRQIHDAYQNYLRDSNAMDFDDLIILSVHLLETNPKIRDSESEWFRYLLIDEFQDTNGPQYQLIRLLTSRHRNVSAVGDEDQSIYRFRGATIQNILQFERDFPGTTVVKLEQNYRSSQTILDAATAVVANNLERKGKVLWTEGPKGELLRVYAAADAREEAAYVGARILQATRSGDTSLAVLYRTNFQSRLFEEVLRRFDIPYRVIGGTSFYSRKEIKDALAYLRVVRNPRDNVSLQRIINQPARGIGSKTTDTLFGISKSQSKSTWDSILEALEGRTFPARTHLALARFVDLIEESSGDLSLPIHLLLEKILEKSGYLEALRSEGTEEAESRLLNLKELITVADEYDSRRQTIQEFLDDAALYSDTDDYDSTSAVTLMTLHNAKGLEFDTVFLVGCEEGLFPHNRALSDDDLEEERRLCYVGMTRARRELHMTYSRRRRFYGRESEGSNVPSRFLSEVPQHLVDFRTETRMAGPVRLSPQPHRAAKPYSGKTYNTRESVEQFLAQAQARKSPSRQAISRGALVEHQKFGRGRVLQVQEQGEDLKVTVQFADGIRHLLQSFAHLRVI